MQTYPHGSINKYLLSSQRHLAQLKICSDLCPQKRLRCNKEEKQNKSMIKCKHTWINHGIVRTNTLKGGLSLCKRENEFLLSL